MQNTYAGRLSPIDSHRNTGAARRYALGHSDAELERLEWQGAFYRDLTKDVLQRAGIARGMRVLDVGCGAGDVSLLAGELVGPSGLVVGIDRSPEAVDVARRRATANGCCGWVHFATAELDTPFTEETFDALIGRLVLMYLPSPATTLRRLCHLLCPRGIIAFQELVLPLGSSFPEGPLFRRCKGWIQTTFERAGFDVVAGGKLFSTFVAAGLPEPEMIAASRAGGGSESPVYGYMAETVRSLLPAMERTGVATAAEVEVETLAARLRGEAVENGACFVLPPLVGAWTRLPR